MIHFLFIVAITLVVSFYEWKIRKERRDQTNQFTKMQGSLNDSIKGTLNQQQKKS